MNTVTLVTATCALAFGSLAGSTGATELPYRGEGHLMVDRSQLEWVDVASMAPGAKMALLEGDLRQADEPFTFRLRLPADYRIDPHVHPEYERVTVLSGTLHFGHGEEFDRASTQTLSAGDFAVMAPGEPMFGYTEEETVIQLHGTGPWGIEYLDPADDPRQSGS